VLRGSLRTPFFMLLATSLLTNERIGYRLTEDSGLQPFFSRDTVAAVPLDRLTVGS